MHDSGDESDYPETVAQQVAWLQAQFAKALSRSYRVTAAEQQATWDAMLAKPWARTCILIAEVDPGEGHDPGDADTRQRFVYEPGIMITAVIR